MTTRELYLSIINGTINDEAIAKASELLTALDARNEKRKSTDSKEKREAAERRALVFNFLNEHKGECFTREQIAFAIDLDPAKVTGACTALVKDGSAIKTEVKVEKSRKVAYSIA